MNKDHLSYGLNSRTNDASTTTKGSAAPTRKKKGLAGFDSDSSSDDEHRNASTGRSATNKAIAAEQHALRKRAEAALSAEYDYDGEYESFTKNKPEKKKVVQEKSSRYISNLLQSAQRRTQEQEIIYERKIAKEQALEDEEMQYDGKEKFITSAYKRKLEEREEWIRAEKEREQKEKEDDVTKKTAGSFLFAGFGRNVLTGGFEKDGKDDKFDSHRGDSKDNKSEDSDYRRSDASRETERVGHISRRRGPIDTDSYHSAKPQNSNGEYGSTEPAFIGMNNDQTEGVPPKTRRQILEERATKIREARERYFQRKGIQPNQ